MSKCIQEVGEGRCRYHFDPYCEWANFTSPPLPIRIPGAAANSIMSGNAATLPSSLSPANMSEMPPAPQIDTALPAVFEFVAQNPFRPSSNRTLPTQGSGKWPADEVLMVSQIGVSVPEKTARYVIDALLRDVQPMFVEDLRVARVRKVQMSVRESRNAQTFAVSIPGMITATKQRRIALADAIHASAIIDDSRRGVRDGGVASCAVFFVKDRRVVSEHGMTLGAALADAVELRRRLHGFCRNAAVSVVSVEALGFPRYNAKPIFVHPLAVDPRMTANNKLLDPILTRVLNFDSFVCRGMSVEWH